MKIPATITLLLIALISQAQRDSLNQLNSKGKKNGYWIAYVDQYCNPTDSANAYFYGYELYDNGKYVWKFHPQEKSNKEGTMTYQGTLPEKGKPTLIDGTFKSYYTYGLLSEHLVFKAGHPFFWDSYLRYEKDPENIVLRQVFYFDRLYKNIPGTYYYEEHDNGKLSRTYWYYKGKNGWKCYKNK